jgi:beta-lactamase superfamily II metal-dependent hydrolase
MANNYNNLVTMFRRKPGRGNRGPSHPGLRLAGVLIMIACLFGLWRMYEARYAPEPTPSDPTVPAGEELQLYMINVGQGDSLLLRCGGQTMLIDAGPNAVADDLVDYLTQLNVTELTYLAATHPHEDHIGGLDAVIDAFDCTSGQLLTSGAETTTRTYEDVLDAAQRKGLDITVPRRGDRFALGGAAVTVLGPVAEYDDLNDMSLVFHVEHGEVSFLLCADMEQGAEADLLAAGTLPRCDVLKAGHHGSSTSTSQELLDAAQPKYALISCGEGNSYGHPHEETLSRLAVAGATIYRTDRNGTVLIQTDGASVKSTVTR